MQVDGCRHLVPEAAHRVPDALIEPMRPARPKGAPALSDATLAEIDARSRDNLYLKLRTLFLDIADRGVIRPGIDEKTLLLGGARPGTVAGEALRFMAQFKTWGAAAVRQGVGRELYGGQGVAGAVAGMIHMTLGTALMGYLVITLKDLFKGKAPRPPDDPRTSGPLPAGSSLTIARVLPQTQSFSLSTQTTLYLNAIKQAFDYQAMVMQQIAARLANAIQAPMVDPNPLMVLPAAAQRANGVLGFDSNGNPMVLPSLSSSSLSVLGLIRAAVAANLIPTSSNPAADGLVAGDLYIQRRRQPFGGATMIRILAFLFGALLGGFAQAQNVSSTTTRLLTSQAGNVAALRAYTAANMPGAAQTSGYTSDGDGGGALYQWSAASTATDDGCGVIKPASRSTGRWLLSIPQSGINVLQCGAKGDGATNDTAAIQAAATVLASTGGSLVIPGGRTYITTGWVYLASNTHVYAYGATIKAGASLSGGGFFTNLHNSATTLTDSNIVIEGGTLDYGSYAATSGGSFAIMMVSVDHAQVLNTIGNGRSSAGVGPSDFVAFIACNDTLISGTRASYFTNTFFDHWQHPTNARVVNNYAIADIISQAINFNPEATSGPSTGFAATGLTVTGNTIICTGAHACPILPAPLGTGTTVSNVAISKNNLTNIWIAPRGATSNVTITNNVFNGVGGGSSAIGSYAYFGGTPNAVMISGNVFKSPATTSGNYGVIVAGGTNSAIIGNTITGSAGSCYTAAYTGAAVVQVANNIGWSTCSYPTVGTAWTSATATAGAAAVRSAQHERRGDFRLAKRGQFRPDLRNRNDEPSAFGVSQQQHHH